MTLNEKILRQNPIKTHIKIFVFVVIRRATNKISAVFELSIACNIIIKPKSPGKHSYCIENDTERQSNKIFRHYRRDHNLNKEKFLDIIVDNKSFRHYRRQQNF